MTNERLAPLHFPEGFLWGTATSAHQVEGNNTNNQWWEFEQQPGSIWHGDQSGLACDWWRNAEVDFDLMAKLNMNTHRLGVEWSRIEPEPGKFNHSALDRYRAMLDGLHARGIKPLVTLHHFTNPLWLDRSGGWERPEVVTRYQNFVRYTVAALRDLCNFWITINEPLVYMAQGWVRGIWPPQKVNALGVLRVYRHMLLAHAAGYQTIHALQPEANVGAAMAVRLFRPSNPDSLLDRYAGSAKRYVGEHIWFQGMVDGRMRPPVGLGEYNKALANSADFFGVNYYTADYVRFHLNPMTLFGKEHYPTGGEQSDSGQRGVYSHYAPDGLQQILRELSVFGRPIYVTENGLPDRNDQRRPRWLIAHLHQVYEAIQAGSDVRGYYHWTLTDNFEWSEGWGLRFGLIELNPETQERRLRPSAHLFSTMAEANALTEDLVTTYAPALVPHVFSPHTAQKTDSI